MSELQKVSLEAFLQGILDYFSEKSQEESLCLYSAKSPRRVMEESQGNSWKSLGHICRNFWKSSCRNPWISYQKRPMIIFWKDSL